MEIAAGSNNQKAGIEEIMRGLEQVNKIVQQNSLISENTATASNKLQMQSSRLQNTMKQFVLVKSKALSQMADAPASLEFQAGHSN